LSDLIEDLGDGHFLIKPTGEIKKCSRSTAYRHARKAEKAVKEAEELQTQEIETVEEIEDEPDQEVETLPLDEGDSLITSSDSYDEIQVEAPIFDLPSLEDLKVGGGDGENPDTFQGEGDQDNTERDQGFINSLKGAKVVEDDEGNKKIQLKDILIGDNPIIASILSGIDHSLYAWAENKNGIELWDKNSRAVQRKVFVKTLSIVAPKTSIELDPIWVIIGMTGWLYGVPLIRLARINRKPKVKKPAIKNAGYEDQKIEKVVFDE